MKDFTQHLLRSKGGVLRRPVSLYFSEEGGLLRSTLASWKVLRGTFRGLPPLAHVLP